MLEFHQVPFLSGFGMDISKERPEGFIYIHPKSPIGPAEISFAIACARFGPKAISC